MDAGAAIALGRLMTLDPVVPVALLGAEVLELATAVAALSVDPGLSVGTGPLAGAARFVGNGVAVGAGATLGASVELVEPADPPAEAVGPELAGGADTGKSSGTTPF